MEVLLFVNVVIFLISSCSVFCFPRDDGDLNGCSLFSVRRNS